MEVIGALGLFTRPVLGERHLNSYHHCQRHKRKSYCRAFREVKRYRALKLSRAVALVPPIKLRFGGWKALEVITRWNDGRRRHANCSSDNDRGNAEGFLEGFSKLSPDLPWDRGSIWSILATYFFLLHIPLSLGGLSFVAQVLNQKDLNPQTKAISLLLTQTIELIGAIFLVQSEAKLFNPSSKSFKFYFANVWVERGWLKASIAGIATIGLVAIITSPILEFIFKTEVSVSVSLNILNVLYQCNM